MGEEPGGARDRADREVSGDERVDTRPAVLDRHQRPDTVAQIFDARTFKEVKRLTIGQGGSNVGFSKDGKTAFIAVTGANAVAVIDADSLRLAGQIKVGQQPQGLIVR